MNDHHLLGARERNLSHEDFTKGATLVCGGTFHVLKESRTLVVELSAVAVEVLHLSTKEACAKDEKSGAKLFVERNPVQRGDCKVPQHQRDPHGRKLLTNANKGLVTLFPRSETTMAIRNT